MVSPFVRVVANGVHSNNVDGLNRQQDSSNQQLNNAITSFESNKKYASKLSSQHYKISADQEGVSKDIDYYYACKKSIEFEVSCFIKNHLELAHNSSLTSLDIKKVISMYPHKTADNLSLANYQLFHYLFSCLKDKVKNTALNDLYHTAFNILDLEPNSELAEKARKIIKMENSTLNNCREIATKNYTHEDSVFPNFLYDSDASFALNTYNTYNTLTYIYNSQAEDVCDFYNAIVNEYSLNNDFTFTPERLIEIYHPGIYYQDAVNAINKHNQDSLEPYIGTPERFLTLAVTNRITGEDLIKKMGTPSLSAEKKNNKKAELDTLTPKM
jgi:hypothetical protein